MAWVEKIAVDWDHWNWSGWLARPLPDAVLARTAQDQDAFDVRFFEDLLARFGDQYEVLAALGELYTRTGRHREGLAVDRRLAALRPRDSTVLYNLACSLALLNQKSHAFDALRRAVELGYRDHEHMASDPDLESLRGDPRWADLLGVIKS